MRQLRVAVIGYGNRGQVYADYSLDCPNELKIVAVVDPNPFKLQDAQKRYNLSKDMLFDNLDKFLEQNIPCDFVINATMDQIHFETTVKLLNANYNMLLEKPIVAQREQLLEIQRLAEEKSRTVIICHVLRYTPFYRTIKKCINDGIIGEIMTMEMNEHVCSAHYLTSYVRGKWNSESSCGSSFLLAKSCHDLDIMCWLNNATTPMAVSSFGSRSQFVPQRAPQDVTEFCCNCPHDSSCEYSATNLYLRLNAMPFLTWDRLNKPLDEITAEEKEQFLQKDIYGKCAYLCGGDIVDRQVISVQFANGSCCSFTLVGGTTRADRYIHIVGTKGEIVGNLSEDKFKLLTYSKDSFGGNEQVVDISQSVINNAKFGGHSGGDYAIMKDVVRYFCGETDSISITRLEDSVNGHLCVYAAEKSRKENNVQRL